MTDKRNLKSKIATGAVLVALSGFVPKVTKPVHAATATITASGTFSSGIKLTAGNNLQFGVMVATDASGSMSISAGGATSTSKAFFNGGTQQAGSVKFAAGAINKVDITVTGQKNSLTLASFNAVKTGTVNLPSIFMTGPFGGTLTFTPGGTTTTVTLTSVTSDLNIGGVVTWNATQPVGTFSQAIKVTVSY